MLALATAIYVSNRLWAQGPAGAQQQQQQPKSRIAILNLTYVVKHYKKFQTYQEELKKAVEPFQAKDASLKAEGEKLAKEGQTPTTAAARREQIEARLKQIQREIDDNKTDAQKKLAAQQESQLKTLYMDVRSVAEKYAQSHNYEMILHYNDAVTADDYWSGPNIARKMQAGALMPLYWANGIDISANIVQTLNGPAAAPVK
jgi:Skp family chaperone for outer membrane proteins